MILGSPELDEFVVEPWMELVPFDTKLIKEIRLNHPYKILLRNLFKYYPSYRGEENDADPDCQGYEDVSDVYFKMLDDYYRYRIAFQREFDLISDNKLGVLEYKDFVFSEEGETEYGKIKYHFVANWHTKKKLLFNKVKTIDLNEHDTGEKILSQKEKQKRDCIKKQTNKKLQVVLMDPDVYNDDVLFKIVIEYPGKQELLIEKFNHRMTYHGIDDFLRINFD